MIVRRVEPIEEEALPLFNFLIGRADEDGKTVLDQQRAVQGFWQIMVRGIVYVAEVDGKIVGSLALTETPLTWYGPAEMVGRFDDWFVTDPAHRGVVGPRLLRFAAREAGATPVIVRRIRGSINRGVVADILGFNVVGNILQVG